jgi:predicted nucleic-acid-binding protein
MPRKLREATSNRVFIDTNLFLRYLTNDQPKMADEVEKLLRRAAAGRVTLVTHVLVMTEIVWTLASFYKVSREDIRDKVIAIVNTDGLEVENAGLILQAAIAFADKNIDFIDAYTSAWCAVNLVPSVCTFDQSHFKRLAGVVANLPKDV